jgi:hypothetical protein
MEGEDIAFTKLAELAREASEDKWESKVDKYVNDGLTEEEARLNANRKLNGVDLNQIMSSYNFVKAISSPSSIIVCSSKRAFLESLKTSSSSSLFRFKSLILLVKKRMR